MKIKSSGCCLFNFLRGKLIILTSRGAGGGDGEFKPRQKRSKGGYRGHGSQTTLSYACNPRA